MTTNLPPSPADIARLFARVERLERALAPRGARVVNELEDVNADYPNDGDAIVYDAASGKYMLGAAAGGGGTPTDWADLQLAAGQTGLAQNTNHHVTFDAGGSDIHGSAISVDGSGDAVVNADGWYTLAMYLEGQQAGVGTWDLFTVSAVIQRGYTTGGDTQADVTLYSLDDMGSTTAPSSIRDINWTGYMLAGSTVVVTANMSGNATWNISDGILWMEKLPI